jgi:N-acetylglucosamine kinase-like BadF-type ATPase
MDDTLRTGMTVTAAVAVPPSVALTVAVCAVATAAEIAVNAAAGEPAGIVRDAGTGSAVLFEASATTAPPAGAF